MTGKAEKCAILVVEDEQSIRRGLCDALAYAGYEPHGVETGEDGLREAQSNRYDLVVLDLMLPGLSGFDVCEQTRAQLPEQPILMLTARGSEDDVLEGFARGADDYVTKPFSVSELLARVAALLRRSGRRSESERPAFGFANWNVDPATGRAGREGDLVELSPRELAILALFVREQGRIVSRRTLLREIWGFANPERIETRTVDMQIGKLRRKLDGEGESPIETVRGAGYRYTGS